MLINALLALGLLFSSSPAESKTGTKAKDFTVSSLTGEEISLAQLRGKVVLINFWATWCMPCREELPRLSSLQEKLRMRGLVVLAISVDNERENIAEFLRQNGVKLQAFWDRDKRISRLYDPQTMPSSYVIDRNGSLRFIHNGYSDSELKQIDAEINQLLKQGAPIDMSPKNKL
jgi:peroxiredoxin